MVRIELLLLWLHICAVPLDGSISQPCAKSDVFHNLTFPSCREWPNPVLLKQPEDSNLNLPVWDPRVSMMMVLYLHMSLMLLCVFVCTGNIIWTELNCWAVKSLLLKLAHQMEYSLISLSPLSSCDPDIDRVPYMSSKALNCARRRPPRAARSKEDFPRGRLLSDIHTRSIKTH